MATKTARVIIMAILELSKSIWERSTPFLFSMYFGFDLLSGGVYLRKEYITPAVEMQIYFLCPPKASHFFNEKREKGLDGGGQA